MRKRGIDPSAAYECLDTKAVHRGAVLLHHGLHTGLKGDMDATVIRLRRR
ncbi:GH36 C-terminal domain-containing protein [Streptomyces sp. NBC_01142]|nr:GH36 C-terminal domain-containing protein [Streptomyces sp. NBC_01142]MCX4820713.1 GH36 C-terminal domain-containing protein [Streptomyces sp. NBC_01142]